MPLLSALSSDLPLVEPAKPTSTTTPLATRQPASFTYALDGGPAKDECFVKGGAYLNVGANLDCRVDGRGASRDRRGQEIGLRCCSN